MRRTIRRVQQALALITGSHSGMLGPSHVRRMPPSGAHEPYTDNCAAWIDSYEGDDLASGCQPTDRLLAPPSRAHNAQHNHAPTNPSRRVSLDGYVDTYDDSSHGISEKKPEAGFFGPKEPVRGRKWDHARDGDPVIMQSGGPPASSPWRLYIKSSMYGPALSEDGKRVDEEFLEAQTPGYQKPWRGDLDGGNDPEKLSGLIHNKKQRRTLIKRWQVRVKHAQCEHRANIDSIYFLCTPLCRLYFG
jgi:hypothetical protein